ncbi:protein of unknown function [Burkholderia multivorans]
MVMRVQNDMLTISGDASLRSGTHPTRIP